MILKLKIKDNKAAPTIAGLQKILELCQATFNEESLMIFEDKTRSVIVCVRGVNTAGVITRCVREFVRNHGDTHYELVKPVLDDRIAVANMIMQLEDSQATHAAN